MERIPRAYEIYRHFKGNLYQIVTMAQHSETGEPLVIYQALYGDFKIYARPLSMFMDKVDKIKYPQAEQEFRFVLQSAPECDGRRGEALSVQEAGRGGEALSVQEAGRRGEALSVQEPETVEELQLDPLLLEFLDADTYEQRLRILSALHHRITDEMINTMAAVCDIEVEEGDTQERYESLKNCLLTLKRYECNRLR